MGPGIWSILSWFSGAWIFWHIGARKSKKKIHRESSGTENRRRIAECSWRLSGFDRSRGKTLSSHLPRHKTGQLLWAYITYQYWKGTDQMSSENIMTNIPAQPVKNIEDMINWRTHVQNNYPLKQYMFFALSLEIITRLMCTCSKVNPVGPLNLSLGPGNMWQNFWRIQRKKRVSLKKSVFYHSTKHSVISLSSAANSLWLKFKVFSNNILWLRLESIWI